jgi:hypothetical protein
MPAVAQASAKLDYLAFLSQLLRPTHQSTSSGAGLCGRSSSSTLHPNVFCTQPMPFSLPF